MKAVCPIGWWSFLCNDRHFSTQSRHVQTVIVTCNKTYIKNTDLCVCLFFFLSLMFSWIRSCFKAYVFRWLSTPILVCCWPSLTTNTNNDIYLLSHLCADTTQTEGNPKESLLIGYARTQKSQNPFGHQLPLHGLITQEKTSADL